MSTATDFADDDLYIETFIEKLRRQNEARKLLRPKTTLRDYAAMVVPKNRSWWLAAAGLVVVIVAKKAGL